jgi:hypothetical protein
MHIAQVGIVTSEDHKGDGHGHEGGEENGGGHQGADHHQDGPGERQAGMGHRLVPPRAAEARHDQGREPAEGRERGHLEIADELIGHGEQNGDDESSSQRLQP